MQNNIQIPKTLILSILKEVGGEIKFHDILRKTRISDDDGTTPKSSLWDLADYQKALKDFFLRGKSFTIGQEDGLGNFAISLQPSHEG